MRNLFEKRDADRLRPVEDIEKLRKEKKVLEDEVRSLKNTSAEKEAGLQRDMDEVRTTFALEQQKLRTEVSVKTSTQFDS